LKKKWFVVSSLALLVGCASFFITIQLRENDSDMIVEVSIQRTLQVLGIETDIESIKSSQSVKDRTYFTDGDGKKWVYIEYTDRTAFIEDMENYYNGGFIESFIGVQASIMRKHSQIGDYIPIILLDEDLQQGSFTFSRDSGETLSFPIHYEYIKGWVYEEPILFESA